MVITSIVLFPGCVAGNAGSLAEGKEMKYVGEWRLDILRKTIDIGVVIEGWKDPKIGSVQAQTGVTLRQSDIEAEVRA